MEENLPYPTRRNYPQREGGGGVILSDFHWKQKPGLLSTSPAMGNTLPANLKNPWEGFRRSNWGWGGRMSHRQQEDRIFVEKKGCFWFFFHIDFAEIKVPLDDTKFQSAVQGGGDRSSYSRSQYTSTKRVQEFFRGFGLLAVIFQVYDIDRNVSCHSRVLCRSRHVI